MKNKNIKVDQGDLKILLSQAYRYAVSRDNHLAPLTIINTIKKYIDLFDKVNKDNILDNLINEIDFDIKFKKLREKKIWEEFLEWLKDKREVQ